MSQTPALTRIAIASTLAMASISLLCRCGHNSQQDGPPTQYVDISKIPNAKPVKLKKSRYGNPAHYKVFGKRYKVLNSAKGYDKIGIASWYGKKFHGRLTSTREPYDMFAMTAASPNLPLPTFARVTNLKNGRSIIVKINDRGPFAPNRIIDLSYVAAKKLDMLAKGTAKVRVTAIIPGQFKRHTPLYAENSAKPTQPPTSTYSTHAYNKTPAYLQLGAFHDASNAKYLREKLLASFTQRVSIAKGNKHGKVVYKVRLGPLRSSKKINELRNSLSQRGFGEAMTIPVQG